MNVNKRISLINSLCWAILLFFTILLTGCDKEIKDGNAYMLQCISNPSPNSQSKQFETIIDNGKVSCHALLWRIPKQYSPDVKVLVTDSGYSEIISKRVVLHKAPTNVLPILSLSERSKEGVNEILFEQYWPSSFLLTPDKTRLDDLIYIIVGQKGFKKTESFNGWQVYLNEEDFAAGGYSSVVFTKTKPVQYFLDCNTSDLASIKPYQEIPKDKMCRVYTYIDSRVYAKYWVSYAQINQMDEINNKVIRFAKSLMLN